MHYEQQPIFNCIISLVIHFLNSIYKTTAVCVCVLAYNDIRSEFNTQSRYLKIWKDISFSGFFSVEEKTRRINKIKTSQGDVRMPLVLHEMQHTRNLSDVTKGL